MQTDKIFHQNIYLNNHCKETRKITVNKTRLENTRPDKQTLVQFAGQP